MTTVLESELISLGGSHDLRCERVAVAKSFVEWRVLELRACQFWLDGFDSVVLLEGDPRAYSTLSAACTVVLESSHTFSVELSWVLHSPARCLDIVRVASRGDTSPQPTAAASVVELRPSMSRGAVSAIINALVTSSSAVAIGDQRAEVISLRRVCIGSPGELGANTSIMLPVLTLVYVPPPPSLSTFALRDLAELLAFIADSQAQDASSEAEHGGAAHFVIAAEEQPRAAVGVIPWLLAHPLLEKRMAPACAGQDLLRTPSANLISRPKLQRSSHQWRPAQPSMMPHRTSKRTGLWQALVSAGVGRGGILTLLLSSAANAWADTAAAEAARVVCRAARRVRQPPCIIAAASQTVLGDDGSTGRDSGSATVVEEPTIRVSGAALIAAAAEAAGRSASTPVPAALCNSPTESFSHLTAAGVASLLPADSGGDSISSPTCSRLQRPLQDSRIHPGQQRRASALSAVAPRKRQAPAVYSTRATISMSTMPSARSLESRGADRHPAALAALDAPSDDRAPSELSSAIATLLSDLVLLRHRSDSHAKDATPRLASAFSASQNRPVPSALQHFGLVAHEAALVAAVEDDLGRYPQRCHSGTWRSPERTSATSFPQSHPTDRKPPAENAADLDARLAEPAGSQDTRRTAVAWTIDAVDDLASKSIKATGVQAAVTSPVESIGNGAPRTAAPVTSRSDVAAVSRLIVALPVSHVVSQPNRAIMEPEAPPAAATLHAPTSSIGRLSADSASSDATSVSEDSISGAERGLHAGAFALPSLLPSVPALGGEPIAPLHHASAPGPELLATERLSAEPSQSELGGDYFARAVTRQLRGKMPQSSRRHPTAVYGGEVPHSPLTETEPAAHLQSLSQGHIDGWGGAPETPAPVAPETPSPASLHGTHVPLYDAGAIAAGTNPIGRSPSLEFYPPRNSSRHHTGRMASSGAQTGGSSVSSSSSSSHTADTSLDASRLSRVANDMRHATPVAAALLLDVLGDAYDRATVGSQSPPRDSASPSRRSRSRRRRSASGIAHSLRSRAAAVGAVVAPRARARSAPRTLVTLTRGVRSKSAGAPLEPAVASAHAEPAATSSSDAAPLSSPPHALRTPQLELGGVFPATPVVAAGADTPSLSHLNDASAWRRHLSQGISAMAHSGVRLEGFELPLSYSASRGISRQPGTTSDAGSGFPPTGKRREESSGGGGSSARLEEESSGPTENEGGGTSSKSSSGSGSSGAGESAEGGPHRRARSRSATVQRWRDASAPDSAQRRRADPSASHRAALVSPSATLARWRRIAGGSPPEPSRGDGSSHGRADMAPLGSPPASERLFSDIHALGGAVLAAAAAPVGSPSGTERSEREPSRSPLSGATTELAAQARNYVLLARAMQP